MPDKENISPACYRCGSTSMVPSLLTAVVQYWRCVKCNFFWATPLPTKTESEIQN